MLSSDISPYEHTASLPTPNLTVQARHRMCDSRLRRFAWKLGRLDMLHTNRAAKQHKPWPAMRIGER